ncbi:hypothetical protein C8F01DRAFT_1087955 [Mycena amicta]|nr:hypothetical protein C8F01DRAFT_1087955 [Mycena amicta]
MVNEYYPENEILRLARTHLLQLAQVCARWRDIIMMTPSFWAKFALDISALESPSDAKNLMHQELLANLLLRSQQQPLSFRVVLSNQQSLSAISLFNILSKDAFRWKDVGLWLDSQWLPSLSMIKGQLPLLQRLELHTREEPIPSFAELDIFQNTPMLSASILLPEKLKQLPLTSLPSSAIAWIAAVFSAAERDMTRTPPIVSHIDTLQLGISIQIASQDEQVISSANQQTIGYILSQLTLPNLSSFILAPDPLQNHTLHAHVDLFPIWNPREYAEFATRSSFASCLQKLTILAKITQADLLSALAGLNCLESLTICDVPGAKTFIVDALLNAFMIKDSGQQLIGQLQYLALLDLTGFHIKLHWLQMRPGYDRQDPDIYLDEISQLSKTYSTVLANSVSRLQVQLSQPLASESYTSSDGRDHGTSSIPKEALLRRRLDEIGTEIDTLLALRISVSKELKEVILNSIPNEIWLEIFLQYASDEGIDPFPLALVCRNWKNLVLSSPRLWSVFNGNSWIPHDKARFNHLMRCLRYSESLALDLGHYGTTHIIGTAARFSAKWREVFNCTMVDLEPIQEVLHSLVYGNLPKLEVLHVIDNEEWELDSAFSAFQLAPALQKVYIEGNGITPLTLLLPWAQIKELNILSQSANVTPNIEDLVLNNIYSEVLQIRQQFPMVVLPKMERFELDRYVHLDVVESLQLPILKILEVHCGESQQPLNILADLLQRSQCSVTLLILDMEEVDWSPELKKLLQVSAPGLSNLHLYADTIPDSFFTTICHQEFLPELKILSIEHRANAKDIFHALTDFVKGRSGTLQEFRFTSTAPSYGRKAQAQAAQLNSAPGVLITLGPPSTTELEEDEDSDGEEAYFSTEEGEEAKEVENKE